MLPSALHTLPFQLVRQHLGSGNMGDATRQPTVVHMGMGYQNAREAIDTKVIEAAGYHLFERGMIGSGVDEGRFLPQQDIEVEVLEIVGDRDIDIIDIVPDRFDDRAVVETARSHPTATVSR